MQYQGLKQRTYNAKQNQKVLEMIGGVAVALSSAFKAHGVDVDWSRPDGYTLDQAKVGSRLSAKPRSLRCPLCRLANLSQKKKH